MELPMGRKNAGGAAAFVLLLWTGLSGAGVGVVFALAATPAPTPGLVGPQSPNAAPTAGASPAASAPPSLAPSPSPTLIFGYIPNNNPDVAPGPALAEGPPEPEVSLLLLVVTGLFGVALGYGVPRLLKTVGRI
jgi:hypothetical protein